MVTCRASSSRRVDSPNRERPRAALRRRRLRRHLELLRLPHGTKDVPLVVPEVNAESPRSHRVAGQRAKPPAASSSPTRTAAPSASSFRSPPLHERFGIEKLFVSTMQAVSGAGYPGVAFARHPRQRHPLSSSPKKRSYRKKSPSCSAASSPAQAFSPQTSPSPPCATASPCSKATPSASA